MSFDTRISTYITTEDCGLFSVKTKVTNQILVYILCTGKSSETCSFAASIMNTTSNNSRHCYLENICKVNKYFIFIFILTVMSSSLAA